MLASSRTPLRARRFAHAVVATGALVLALAGCSGDSTPKPPPADATVESTPLGGYDTTDVTLARGEFCSRVAEGAVAAALGGDPTGDDSWQPGARLPGSKDISNEFGCSWSSGSTVARAWVFAPPIASDRAADFAQETLGRRCRELDVAAELGRPSIAQECAGLTGIYGLVGDAWVGCEIGGTRSDTALVGEWCVAVLDAMRSA